MEKAEILRESILPSIKAHFEILDASQSTSAKDLLKKFIQLVASNT